MADNNSQNPSYHYRQQIISYTELSLGSQMIDIDLDKEHYDMAIDQALLMYRQRAEAAEEQSYTFLPLELEVQEYILPKEIKAVTCIYRRGTGGLAGGAGQFEPFSSGFLNTYMLVAGRVGGLASYEMFVSYQKLTMMMFGGYIDFNWNPATRKLTLMRHIPFEGETVMLQVYNYKPDHVLLDDHRIYAWVQEYAYNKAKYTLGEAREQFATIIGPQGGSSLNGTALKAEAKTAMDELMNQLKNFVDGSRPLAWVVG